jgi:hypothetical protein
MHKNVKNTLKIGFILSTLLWGHPIFKELIINILDKKMCSTFPLLKIILFFHILVFTIFAMKFQLKSEKLQSKNQL